MGKYGAAAVLFLAGLAVLYPATASWAYIASFIAFELWLLRRMSAVGRDPIRAGEAPYRFSEEEAGFVGRYRFYFSYPAAAREASSVLAALGLTALVLAPWLSFRQALIPAVLAGLNLFVVARLTKQLAPLLALRLAASKGDRPALRLLELHDPLWAKIRAANETGS